MKRNYDPESAAYGKSLRFLAPRARSIEEMRCYLTKKGIPDSILESTLSRLVDEGLLDDAEFAGMFVRSRERTKPRSKFALTCELRQKGVSDAIITSTLESVDEYASAWNAVSRRIPGWRRFEKDTFKKKLFNYLQYRGFSYEIIQGTWERACETGEEFNEN